MESEEARAERLAAERLASQKAAAQEAVGHALSYLKCMLNPTVDDDALKAAWLELRAKVGDPVDAALL